MKQQPKLSKVTPELKEQLAILTSYKEFKAFFELLKIEENAIVMTTWLLNSSDPSLGLKKAHYEGRMAELRAIYKVFSDLYKKKE
jgi:hypothetical protein